MPSEDISMYSEADQIKIRAITQLADEQGCASHIYDLVFKSCDLSTIRVDRHGNCLGVAECLAAARRESPSLDRYFPAPKKPNSGTPIPRENRHTKEEIAAILSGKAPTDNGFGRTAKGASIRNDQRNLVRKFGKSRGSM